MAAKQKKAMQFQKKLILNQWILGLFGLETFDDLVKGLKDSKLEDYTGNNISCFCDAMTGPSKDYPHISKDALIKYDDNIIKHTQKLNKHRRGQDKIVWKYFQYLALLFTEIYLARYFGDTKKMLDDLNEKLDQFNKDNPNDQLEQFSESGLRRIAFFQATGSGKTLLMHINIMQYQHYLKKFPHKDKINRVILLTPNDGLSKQHLAEFEKSGMFASLFKKNEVRTPIDKQRIDIINIQKIGKSGDKMDEKVDVATFEDNNLVLVDEGHRGSSGDDWMDKRNRLCKDGFSFEYSATFEQAIFASKDKDLEQQYAKAILFNYSYKYFYEDGFGKDYTILNLDSKDKNYRDQYLVACLLAFYQQMRIFEDHRNSVQKIFNLEKPLLVLVGASVNTKNDDDKASDVVEFLRFLADFIKSDKATIEQIKAILTGNHGLHHEGANMFSDAFDYLGHDYAAIYVNMKTSLFHSQDGAFAIKHLKDSKGEIALHLGGGEPFGVINVGDPVRLIKKCEQSGFKISQPAFSKTYFSSIDMAGSPINILIGSKKFSEGWNSWRVSTMGLLNVGRGVGSEIIQLFGRGVRLKGAGFSLKRSNRQEKVKTSPPKHIKKLETLNIFGVRAGYMEQFRKLLEEAGLGNGDAFKEITVPLIYNYKEATNLKMLRLKEGMDYKEQGPRPLIEKNGGGHKVVLNWYPKVQMNASQKAEQAGQATQNECWFEPFHLNLLNINKIFFDMVSYKERREFHNLAIRPTDISGILLDKTWYTIKIPAKSMCFSDDGIVDDIALWQELAVALMEKYIDRIYGHARTRWEHNHLEYQVLNEEDGNFPRNKDTKQLEYVISVKATCENIIKHVEDLADDPKRWKLDDIGNLVPDDEEQSKVLWMDKHLYQPLIHVKDGFEIIKIKPTALNEGEAKFIDDLKAYVNKNPQDISDKDLYLLRNQSKGVGLGFFDEAVFYPDFILWIVDKNSGRQHINFIDPHGLHHTGGDDKKINLCDRIKDIETELANKNIKLNSFVVSTTLRSALKGVEELEKRNVVFQEDKYYIHKIVEKSLQA